MVKQGHPLGPYLRGNPREPIGLGEGEHSLPRGSRPSNSPNASPRIRTRVEELGEEWGYQLGTALLVYNNTYDLLFIYFSIDLLTTLVVSTNTFFRNLCVNHSF